MIFNVDFNASRILKKGYKDGYVVHWFDAKTLWIFKILEIYNVHLYRLYSLYSMYNYVPDHYGIICDT
jgi:hypothetical protein